MSLYLREIHANRDEGYIFYESDVKETRFNTRGDVFRWAQKEYGKCVSKVYIERPNGKAKTVGWVFAKKVEYEDSGRYGREAEYYERDVWIEIHKRMPKIERKYYY